MSISFGVHSGGVSTAVPPEENSPRAFLNSFQDSGWKSGEMNAVVITTHRGCWKAGVSLPGKEMCLYSKLNQKKQRLKGFGTEIPAAPKWTSVETLLCFPLEDDQTLPSIEDSRLAIMQRYDLWNHFNIDINISI